MFKKVVVPVAALSISALASVVAQAAAPGFYATGQLGYANTHMKNQLNKNEDLKYLFPNSTLSNNGAAGRLAVGYQFNQNFAVEMGYMRFSKSKYDGYFTAPDLEPPASATISASLKQNAFDIAGKGILPVSDKFNVYGKLGVAYLTSNLDGTFTEKVKNKTTVTNIDGLVSTHVWAPEAAIGVSYDITPNVSVDTSWTHIQPLGSKRPGNIDFVSVGLGYNFG